MGLIRQFISMMMGKMCTVHKIAWVLVIVGALNWGLLGAFNINLVNMIIGSWPMVERVVYILVGLSAIFMFFTGSCKACKMCESGMKKM
ncbi:MAG: DUF378 domain-containing protein [Patescibacteria group bacterium]